MGLTRLQMRGGTTCKQRTPSRWRQNLPCPHTQKGCSSFSWKKKRKLLLGGLHLWRGPLTRTCSTGSFSRLGHKLLGSVPPSLSIVRGKGVVLSLCSPWTKWRRPFVPTCREIKPWTWWPVVYGGQRSRTSMFLVWTEQNTAAARWTKSVRTNCVNSFRRYVLWFAFSTE